MFFHPIKAIERLVHGHVGEFIKALIGQLEAQNPEIKIAVDAVEELAHEFASNVATSVVAPVSVPVPASQVVSVHVDPSAVAAPVAVSAPVKS